MADITGKQPAPQPRTATQFGPHESGTPKTGFVEAPTSSEELGNFSAGPGVPPGGTKIR